MCGYRAACADDREAKPARSPPQYVYRPAKCCSKPKSPRQEEPEFGAERINGSSFVFVFMWISIIRPFKSRRFCALSLHAHNLIFNQQYYNKQNRLKQKSESLL